MRRIGRKLSSYILLSAFCSSFVNSSAVNASEECESNNGGTVYINYEKDSDEKTSSILPVAVGIGVPSSAALIGASAYCAKKFGLLGGSAGNSSESALERSDDPEDNALYMRKVVSLKKPFSSYAIDEDRYQDLIKKYNDCDEVFAILDNIIERESRRFYSDGSMARVVIMNNMIQIGYVDCGGQIPPPSRVIMRIFPGDDMKFEPNEKVNALVEKMYELRKRFEECDKSEEYSLKRQITSAMDELSDELFKIYVETREKKDGVKLTEVPVPAKVVTNNKSKEIRRKILYICLAFIVPSFLLALGFLFWKLFSSSEYDENIRNLNIDINDTMNLLQQDRLN